MIRQLVDGVCTRNPGQHEITGSLSITQTTKEMKGTNEIDEPGLFMTGYLPMRAVNVRIFWRIGRQD
jgi:hypothetical protein